MTTLFDLSGRGLDSHGDGFGAMSVHELPAARLESFGASALADSELLALLLGGPADKALALARQIIAKAGNLAAVAVWTKEDFAAFPGIGATKAAQLQTVAEVARRIASQDAARCEPLLDRAEKIFSYMQPLALGLEVEKFWVLSLNRKNRLMRCEEISSGTATAALAHPREVFRSVIKASGAAFCCVHNHPSGDPAPSAPDLHVTRMLREAAKAVDIDFVDHVVMGRAGVDPLGRGFFSFREAGMI